MLVVMKHPQQVGGRVIETSSKTGRNVEDLFSAVVEDYVEDHLDALPPSENSSFPLHTGKIRSRCCH